MKKTRSRKSHDTVPLNEFCFELLPMVNFVRCAVELKYFKRIFCVTGSKNKSRVRIISKFCVITVHNICMGTVFVD
jgi:hypothetical protein